MVCNQQVVGSSPTSGSTVKSPVIIRLRGFCYVGEALPKQSSKRRFVEHLSNMGSKTNSFIETIWDVCQMESAVPENRNVVTFC